MVSGWPVLSRFGDAECSYNWYLKFWYQEYIFLLTESEFKMGPFVEEPILFSMI